MKRAACTRLAAPACGRHTRCGKHKKLYFQGNADGLIAARTRYWSDSAPTVRRIRRSDLLGCSA